MIRLSPFTILFPTSVDEAATMVAGTDGETRILAGGTDVVVKLKHELYWPTRLVWLGKIKALGEIVFSPTDGLRIGAMCTLSEIGSSPEVVKHYPALASAVQSVASPAVRNRATIGGNLCLDTRCSYYEQSEFWREALGGCLKRSAPSHAGEEICHAAPGLSKCSAVFCSDAAPILIALGASVRVVSASGKRTIALSDLYQDDGIHFLTLASAEFIRDVLVPAPVPGQRSAFKKIRSRGSIDFAIVNVGVSVVANGGVCSDARIVVGAVRSAPIRVHDAEAILVGHELTSERINLSASVASSSLKPLPISGRSVGYRKKMVRVLVERALCKLVEG